MKLLAWYYPEGYNPEDEDKHIQFLQSARQVFLNKCSLITDSICVDDPGHNEKQLQILGCSATDSYWVYSFYPVREGTIDRRPFGGPRELQFRPLKRNEIVIFGAREATEEEVKIYQNAAPQIRKNPFFRGEPVKFRRDKLFHPEKWDGYHIECDFSHPWKNPFALAVECDMAVFRIQYPDGKAVCVGPKKNQIKRFEIPKY